MKRLLTLITLLILTACAAPVTPTSNPTVTSTATATPSPPPSLTPAVIDTATPTAIPTSTPTPILTLDLTLPTPDFLNSPIADGYILATGGPDCQLPCWQGLQVGISTRQDVLDVFNALFDFGSYIDFFDEDVAQQHSVAKAVLDIPGMAGGGYGWETQETLFDLYVIVDTETNTLKGLRFDHLTGLYSEGLPHRYAIRTPLQLIEQLGTPSSIYTRKQGNILMGVILFFEEGIVSQSYLEIEVGQRFIEGHKENYAEFCLDDQAWSAEDYIIEPFERSLEEPIPSNSINDHWILESIEPTGHYPIEEALDLTIEEFVAISQSEHPCIELNYNMLPRSVKDNIE